MNNVIIEANNKISEQTESFVFFRSLLNGFSHQNGGQRILRDILITVAAWTLRICSTRPGSYFFRSFSILQISCLCIALCGLANAQKAKASEDGAKLELGDRVLLTSEKDGFMSVHQVRYSPDGKHFVVIGCGYECNDNVGFLFNADGTGKRKFTAPWDFILQDKIEWSADGKKLYYYRINSTGADPPANAPSESWIEVNLKTGRKAFASSRRLKPGASYAVFNVLAKDSLNARSAPGIAAKISARLPYNARDVKFSGQMQRIGKVIWVRIEFGGVSGWVNQNFLYEETKEQ